MRKRLVVFTDLDGCLLDERTYRYDAALPAVEALRRARVPLVLCTSKTRAEVEPLHRALRLRAPFVVENGGGIVIPEGTRGWRPPLAPRDGGPLVLPIGAPYAALVQALREIAAETGLRLLGFSDLPVEEVAERTGLPLEAARLAAAREFDEPFVIEGLSGAGEDEAGRRVAEAAQRRGLRATRGGRFHHLTGPVDKGKAVRQLLALHEGPTLSVALGDSLNDRSLLEAVDRAVIVPRPDGSPNEALAGALPAARRAPWPGPRGWNEAVLGVLAEARARPAREDVAR